MKFRQFVMISMMISLFLPTDVFSEEVGAEQKLIQALSVALPGVQVTSVKKSFVEGLYEVEVDGQFLYVNQDGSFFISGDLYSTEQGRLVNLTEVKKDLSRAKQIESIAVSDRIVFPAVGEVKAKIAVFTDIDCGYCRKLHKEVPQLNSMGVEVSYLAYPRAGIGSASYNKIVSAWCSDDRLQALTDAKLGKDIPVKDCKNPIAEQFVLGQRVGVRGTPAIVLENGKLIPGYLPAEELAKRIGIIN